MAPELRRGPTLRAWPGILMLLAVALPWYLLVMWKNPGLLSYYIGEEVIGRIASDQHSRNAEWYGGIAVYIPTLLVGTLPWTYWLLRAAWRAIASLNIWAVLKSLQTKQRFLLLWLFLPLCVFFLARSRLPLYILPLMAPLALLVAGELLKRPAFPTRRNKWLLAAWICLLLVFRGVSGLVESHKDARAAAALLREAGATNCTEFAFYETRPMLGLYFYLNCEVEQIDAGNLAEELAEKEQRLWVVSPTVVDRFEAEMKANNRNYEPAAELPELWLIFRELGDSSASQEP
jgi:4-amino-4-deoxy-L-arabinose transferase